MEYGLIEPVGLKFDGLDADQHRIDALYLGQSLAGTAKIYNSLGMLYFEGKLGTSAHSRFRVQVGPPERGSVLYLVYLLLVHGEMAVYPELLIGMAELALPEFMRAMVARKTGQEEHLGRALDIIERQSQRYHEMVRATQDNDMQTRQDLLGVIDKLVSKNGAGLAEMAAPVGRSVRGIAHVPSRSDPIEIDAPTAEALRSKDELSVGDSITLVGVVTALDVETGLFKLETETGQFRGTVTDPALKSAGNVYSHSLDAVERIEIVAKPTLKVDGSVSDFCQ